MPDIIYDSRVFYRIIISTGLQVHNLASDSFDITLLSNQPSLSALQGSVLEPLLFSIYVR